MKRERQTKIVSTLGPSSTSEEVIGQLIQAGADVFRLNFSHGTYEEHALRLARIRDLEKQFDRPIGVFADLQGPKLRLGNFRGGSVNVSSGSDFRLDTTAEEGDERRAPLPHPEIFEVLETGSQLLLDDGKVRLEVLKCGADFIDTRVIVGGRLSDHKGVNLPDALLATSPLTEKDRRDLAFALDQGMSMIALSFVQRPEDVIEAQELIAGRARLIVKLEKPSAVQHLSKIVDLTDSVMVARGDLGVELPPQEVPAIQKKIIRTCRYAGKPVIVATQMLESMLTAPTPTRAEASDVANAVYEGADAVMLSGETAAGKYPVEAVSIMDRIIRYTQADPAYRRYVAADWQVPETTNSAAITAAARNVASTIGAKLIVTFTSSGSTTCRAARERPDAAILALTPDGVVAHNLTLVWGVYPMQVPSYNHFEELIGEAVACAQTKGYVSPGDHLVVTAGLPLATPGMTNALHIVQIPEVET